MQDSEPSRKREARATPAVAGGNQEVREGEAPAAPSEGGPDVRSRAVLAFILRTMKTRKGCKHECTNGRKACRLPAAVWSKDGWEIRTYSEKTRGEAVS